MNDPHIRCNIRNNEAIIFRPSVIASAIAAVTASVFTVCAGKITMIVSCYFEWPVVVFTDA